MTILDKYLYSWIHYDKLEHAAWSCFGVFLVNTGFSLLVKYTLLKMSFFSQVCFTIGIVFVLGIMKELIDCWVIDYEYEDLEGGYRIVKETPLFPTWKWQWAGFDGWDILADVVGIVVGVGLVFLA